MRLFIIGNGFDLHFKLHTKVEDFKKILATEGAYDFCSALDVFEMYGVDWNEYESSLADIDIEGFAEDHIIPPDYTSDYERDRNLGITNIKNHVDYLNKAINKTLEKMVKNANEEVERIHLSEEDKTLIEGGDIISFNYTSTVEKLYHRDCFHIHGFYERRESLVFGYQNGHEAKIERELNSDWEEDHDYYIDFQKQTIVDLYHSWKKKLRIKVLKDYLKTIGKIDEVVVMGHSMSEVDGPYFRLIEEMINPTRWTIYCHSEEPDYNKYSFSSRVELINW